MTSDGPGVVFGFGGEAEESLSVKEGNHAVALTVFDENRGLNAPNVAVVGQGIEREKIRVGDGAEAVEECAFEDHPANRMPCRQVKDKGRPERAPVENHLLRIPSLRFDQVTVQEEDVLPGIADGRPSAALSVSAVIKGIDGESLIPVLPPEIAVLPDVFAVAVGEENDVCGN